MANSERGGAQGRDCLSSHERKFPYSNTRQTNRDGGTRAQLGLERSQDAANYRCQFLRLKSLDTDSYDRRLRGCRDGQEGVKVGIKGNDNPVFGACLLEYRCVIRLGETHIARMDGIVRLPVKEGDSPARQSLIQKQLHEIPATSTT